jgi:hypothetical protein
MFLPCQDYHGVDHLPVKDSVNHWELLGANETNGYTYLTIKRSLDTCDDEDVPIGVRCTKLYKTI